MWEGDQRLVCRSGPLAEKTRPLADDKALGIGRRRTQQPQPAGWAAVVGRGLLALRSFAARALRWVGSRPPMAGALSSIRDASRPQAGQAHASWYCAIDRMAVNGPHVGHR